MNAPVWHLLTGRGPGTPDTETIAARLRAPTGLHVSIWAADLPNARFLRFTPTGDLLVSQPRLGHVRVLHRDSDGDGVSDGRTQLLSGLNRPHGLDLGAGWLYVGETDAVLRVPFDPVTRELRGVPTRVVTGLPEGGNHWTRTVRIGPDGWLYVSVGSSCNVCLEDDERRAALLRFQPDGSRGEIFARGLRNTVGFDWQPSTGRLFGTDNGRDLLGDDFPPCELNWIEPGEHYGWPYANGDREPDPDFGADHPERVAASRAPVHAFPAHTAPLGITFVRNPRSPAAYRGAALVALHGSWNRTEKAGYKVVSLHWQPDGSIEERDFLVGFEREEDVIGRPVDVAEGPDGAFYVSDDYAGVIWRVARERARTEIEAQATPTASHPLAGMPAEERRSRAARGARLYEHHACYRCHETARAEAGSVPHLFSDLASRYDLHALESLLETPTPPMPLVSLTREERRDLATFLLHAFGGDER